MRNRSILALAAAVAMVLSVSTRSAEAAIFNNLTDLAESEVFAEDSMFQSVGYVSAFDDQGEFMAGSGVLIDPYWCSLPAMW